MAIRKRKIQANYMKVNGVYELLGTGFTELTESPSAQTTSKRYINQSSATQSITGYEWATPYTADQILSEKALEYIRAIGEMQKLGSDTETEYLIVDLDMESTTTGSYRARKLNVAVQVDAFDDNDGELGISGSLLGVSDPVEGTFNTSTKVFANGFTPATLSTLTVTSVAGTLSGDTAITVAPTLTAGNSYLYKTAATVTLPVYNEVLNTGYTAWNGTSDITATTGNQILIVEVDSSSKAKKAGIATVTAKA